ncbi:T-cell immunoglobulin and mucin domain-containing protein 4-like [Paralichthys olivaceus]|uniref:T-cell immunoglobulin and mucin domain-containing protein 4-like n=1 Tax=Paralichthys olivaceus TaxID=8255 RepID=UPI003752BFB5
MRGLCAFFLSILNQVSSETLSDVIGLIGHNVTLPCRYDTQTHGVLSFCWGLGEVPRSKCSDTVLSSQDGVIELRQSSRYQLLGRETEGDISLTILNAQLSDSGVYGCRVEIPGWFNDQKVNTHLLMEEAQPVTQDGNGEQSEIWTTSAPVPSKVGHFEVFLEVGTIARTGAIFLSTLVIILILIFRRKFQLERSLQDPNTPAVENIYESVPMSDGQLYMKKGLFTQETSG